jgi:hypothetical protein
MIQLSKFKVEVDIERNRKIYSEIPKYKIVADDDKYFSEWLTQNTDNNMKKQLDIIGVDPLNPDEFYSIDCFDHDAKTIQFYCIYNCIGRLLSESGRIKNSSGKYLIDFVDFDAHTKVSVYEKSNRPVSSHWSKYLSDIIEIEVLWVVTK